MGASAAIAAAIAQAVKASGTIVSLEPTEFSRLLERNKEPLVVYAEGGLFATNYQYLMSYKGLAFFTKSSYPLDLHKGVEVVRARSIWVPG